MFNLLIIFSTSQIVEAWVYRCWESAILMLHFFCFSIYLLHFSMIVYCSTRKDVFCCCPVPGRIWEAAAIEELGYALLWVLLSAYVFVICIIEQHMHVLPCDTLPGLVMQQGSWCECSQCLHILCTFPAAKWKQKSKDLAKLSHTWCSLPGRKASCAGLFQTAKHDMHSCSCETSPADLLPPTDQCRVQFFFGDVHWLRSLKGRSSLLCTLI